MTNIVGTIKEQEKIVAAWREINKGAESNRKGAALAYDVALDGAKDAREQLHKARAILTQLQGARHTQRTGHEGPRNKGTQYPQQVSVKVMDEDLQGTEFASFVESDFVEVSAPKLRFHPGNRVQFTTAAKSHRSDSFPADDLYHYVRGVTEHSDVDDTWVIHFQLDDLNPVKTGWNSSWLELA